jgi:hypothetical protein
MDYFLKLMINLFKKSNFFSLYLKIAIKFWLLIFGMINRYIPKL